MGPHAEKQLSLEASAEVDSRWVHRGDFISVRQDKITYPGGRRKTWDIAVHPGAVAIVPLTSNGEIILVEQFRRAIGRITLEIPAGVLEKDELPDICAQRELQEEIGYKAGELTLLGTYFSSPGVFTEKVHLFIARDLLESRLVSEDTHEIDIRVVPFKAALEMVKNGTICDAKTALGILRAESL